MYLDEIPRPDIPETGEKFPFVLCTHQPFWHGDMSMLKSPVTGKRLPEFILTMNDDDAAGRGFINGQTVEISSENGSIISTISINGKMPSGYVLLPEGYIGNRLGGLFKNKIDYVAVQIKPVQNY